MFQLINDEKPTSEDKKLRLLEGGAILAVLGIMGAMLWYVFQYHH
jgi:hypothetical protein